MNTTRTFGPSGTLTQTITVENQSESSGERQQPETLILRLNRRKKKVSWKEGTIDNEFMGKKSSKKCCIFHKDKPIDEDCSDDDNDKPRDLADHAYGCCSNSNGTSD